MLRPLEGASRHLDSLGAGCLPDKAELFLSLFSTHDSIISVQYLIALRNYPKYPTSIAAILTQDSQSPSTKTKYTYKEILDIT